MGVGFDLSQCGRAVSALADDVVLCVGWCVVARLHRGQHGWVHVVLVLRRGVNVNGGRVGWPRWGFDLIFA